MLWTCISSSTTVTMNFFCTLKNWKSLLGGSQSIKRNCETRQAKTLNFLKPFNQSRIVYVNLYFSVLILYCQQCLKVAKLHLVLWVCSTCEHCLELAWIEEVWWSSQIVSQKWCHSSVWRVWEKAGDCLNIYMDQNPVVTTVHPIFHRIQCWKQQMWHWIYSLIYICCERRIRGGLKSNSEKRFTKTNNFY